VRSEDYGRYSCHATSTKGTADKIIEISGMRGHEADVYTAWVAEYGSS
jgi:hypothetical protein